MAIIVEKSKRSINWFGIIFFLVFMGFLAAALYYLFFAPIPQIKVFLPPRLQEATQSFQQVEFIDPQTVVNSKAFSDLQPEVPRPPAGVAGRPNPFAPF